MDERLANQAPSIDNLEIQDLNALTIVQSIALRGLVRAKAAIMGVVYEGLEKIL